MTDLLLTFSPLELIAWTLGALTLIATLWKLTA